MRLLLHSAAGLCATTLLTDAAGAAEDTLPNVGIINYDSIPHPNFDEASSVNQYLEDWAAANDRTAGSSLRPCPALYSESGPDPKDWDLYSNVAELQLCHKPLLFDFAVAQDLRDQRTKAAIKACTADHAPIAKRVESINTKCPVVHPLEIKATAYVGWDGPAGSLEATSQAVMAGGQIQSQISSSQNGCGNNTISFGAAGDTLIGLYSGAQLLSQGVAQRVLNEFTSYADKNGLHDRNMFELCGSQDRGADFVIGIVISLSGDISYIQSTIKSWNDGQCAERLATTKSWADFSLLVPATVSHSNLNTSSGGGISRRQVSPANGDGTCKTINVVAKDTCASLATKCGISGPDFTKINSDRSFCSSLKPDQHVCCTMGNLPNFSPEPREDGSCAVYTVRSGDSCSAIAARYSLTTAKLERFNQNTWGWNGCQLLWAGISMCLSTGDPPMPAPVSNAVCGPTVPGTKRPTDGRNLTELNPCPLNVCCNIWGQCGITSDFCVKTKSETGAPGTAKPGTNGCKWPSIQNCGSDIVESGPPKKTMRIGYFSSWNWNRECLNMHADEIDTNKYTHIHFAFANVTSDFKVDVSGAQDEFERFKKLSGVKKIISFGGWDFSTGPGTFHIIREAVKPANRNIFRDNIVDFVKQNDLDGFDIDWEYPGAPDIPGVPSGDLQEGLNYFKFLSFSKSALGSDRSVSIAAPASYWYLKAFPIQLMAKSLDYIVYMTYDLHGQWDYGNKFASPGCPGGNCLRSHVNLTETLLALSMITKAGVPSNKVAVGVTSYGRSFHMATAGCDGPDCEFTGSSSHSDAKVGMCTKTAGYISDAEINDIIILGNVKKWKDDSNSNIVVYDDVEWVAYMDSETKAYREKVYDAFHFAGTSDWALDLQEFGETRDAEPYEPPPSIEPCTESYMYDTVRDVEAAKDKIPFNCKHQYILSALQKQLKAALDKYNDILKDGYDHKYETFARALKQSWENDIRDFFNSETDEFFDCIQSRADDSGVCKFHNISVACPPKRPVEEAYNLLLIPKDDAKIYKHLEEKYGVSPDAIQEQHWHYGPCLPEQDKICPCTEWGNLIGAKELNPNWKLPNPKDAVAGALKNMTNVYDFLGDAAVMIDLGLYYDSSSETIDATAMPVLMTVAAVDAMEQIKEAGEKIEEEERKNIILLALTAIFFVIPGIGEALGAISGIAAIARIATIIAEVGGAGLGVYDIANDPKSAPLAIFGILMGGLAVRGAAKGWISDAAKARRGMDAVTVKNKGKIVSEGLGQIDTVMKVCRRG